MKKGIKTIFCVLVRLKEAEELFVAMERNAKLRYEGYKKLSEL